MKVRHEAHKVCVVVRTYPRGFLFTWCALALYVAVEGQIIALAVCLTVLLVTLAHTFNRMWAPPVLVALGKGVIPTSEGIGRHADIPES